MSRNRLSFVVMVLGAVGLALPAIPAFAADDWVNVATISPTTTLVSGSICYTDGRDIACDGNMTQLVVNSIATGGLTVTGATQLVNVSASANVSVTGNVSAAKFIGDGSLLTGIATGATNEITSGTTKVSTNSNGYISLTTGGATTGYFDTAGRLIVPGVSVTTISGISSTNGYYSGKVGIGYVTPTSALSVNGNIKFPMGNSLIGAGDETDTPFSYAGASATVSLPLYGLSWQVSDVAGGPSAHLSGWNGINLFTRNLLRLHVDYSGNVGIGTSLPSSTLDVIGGIHGNSVAAGMNNVLFRNVPLYSYTNANYGPPDTTGTAMSAVNKFGWGGGDVVVNYGLTNAGVTWQQSQRLSDLSQNFAYIINPNGGSVGIGTLSPTTQLQVSGTVKANFFVGDGSALTGIGAGGATSEIVSNTTRVSTRSTGYISITNNNVVTGYFDTAGRLTIPGMGIGTAAGTQAATALYVSQTSVNNSGAATYIVGLNNNNPIANGGHALLNLVNADNAAGAYGGIVYSAFDDTNVIRHAAAMMMGKDGTWSAAGTNFPGYLAFFTRPAGANSSQLERIRITGAGFVGISTTTPTTALEVNGTVSATNFVGNGSGLTGLPAGNLSETIAINDLSDASASTVAFSLYMGTGAGGTSSATNNMGVGIYALGNNTTGQFNVANGIYSLYNNSTGASNVGNGYMALYTNTSGYGNVANGSMALRGNTTGDDNVATGYQALYSNTTGAFNLAGGTWALYNNTRGSYNTAEGGYAMRTNTTGRYNTAMGYQALFNGDPVTNTVAIGYNAGYGALSNSNYANGTFVGYSSGQAITTGSNNTFLGALAGDSVTSGGNNIMIGYNADAPTAMTSNSLNIGNTIYGDISMKRIGVNVASPSVALEVGGTVSATKFVGDGSGLTGIAGGGVNLSKTIAINDLKDASASVVKASVFLGNGAGAVSTGNNNTAVGINSLASNTTGASNVANGSYALYNNTTGDSNVAVGYYALASNTGGTANVANGYFALISNNIGSYNVANGYTALYSNGNGSYNVANGYQALYANSTGNYNTANGALALRLNTTGTANTANGYSALTTNTTGTANVANGYYSLYSNTTGGSNAANGYYALFKNTTGSDNAANGYSSLNDNTTGSQNVAIGSGALNSNQTGNNNIGIGYRADVLTPGASNWLNIGNAISGSMVSSSNMTFIGGIVANGIVTATYFEGDGSRLTGIAGGGGSSDKIVSSTTNVTANQTGYVSITNAGVVTGYFDSSGRLIVPSISTSSVMGISATSATFSGSIGVGVATPGFLPANSVYTKGDLYSDNYVRGWEFGVVNTGGVRWGDWTTYITGTGGSNIDMAIANQLALRVLPSQRVTIGGLTTTTVSLEVSGTVSATRFVGDGSGLTGIAGGGVNLSKTIAINDLKDASSSVVNGAVFLGNGSGAVSTGSNNAAVGVGALASNSTGAQNNAMGYRALYTNATGTGNNAVGMQALYANTADKNTAVGDYAMYTNTTGTFSTAYGANALFTNTTGNYNMADGANAMFYNTTGTYNAAGGFGALYSNTTGGTNSGFGFKSQYSNTTGGNNVSLGYSANFYGNPITNSVAVGTNAGLGVSGSTTFTNGTFVGYASGQGITTGGDNAFTGSFSGAANTTGGGNVANGSYAFTANTSGSNNVAVGNNALYSPNPVVGTVAVGYNAGQGSGSTGYSYGTYVGTASGFAVTTGNNNTFFGAYSGGRVTTGSGNIALGYNVNLPTATSSYALNIGNSIFGDMGNAAASVGGASKIGINWVTPTVALQVSGTVSATRFVGDGSGLTGVGGGSVNLSETIAINDLSDASASTVAGSLMMGAGAGTTGTSNTAVGIGAMAGPNKAAMNTAVGTNAMNASYNSKGTVAIGYAALATGAGNAGNSNTVIGTEAGAGMTLGSNNILLGYRAGYNVIGTPALNNGGILIGANTGVDGSYSGLAYLNLGNSLFGDMTNAAANGGAALLGINVSNPSAALEVSGTVSVTALYVNGVAVTGGGGAVNLSETIAINDLKDASASTAAGSLFMGAGAGGTTSATNNTGVGIGAMANNGGGRFNVANGYNALYTNSSGDNNVADGYMALYANTTGYSNVANGSQALRSNNAGANNVAVGGSALYTNTTGTYNTAIGAQALYYNSTASNNTGLGYRALFNNSTGYNNVASGYMTLTNNTTGLSNVANGYQALYTNTTGASNVAVGNAALYSNTIGNYNVATGDSALYRNVIGGYNVAIGQQALANAASVSYSVALGTYAGLGVNGSTAFINGTFVGYRSGFAITTGSNNTFLGYQAGSSVTSGANNLIIGYSVDAPTATSSYALNIGNSIFGDMTNAAAGVGGAAKIGINVVTPTANLEVSGTVSATRFVGDGSGLTGVGGSVNLSKTIAINDLKDASASTVLNSLYLGSGAGGTSQASNNVGVGINALATVASGGGQNTAVGYGALKTITSGTGNVAVGYLALFNNIASNNAASGYGALYNNTSGNNNAVNGNQALYRNTVGSNNVADGANALYNANSVTNTVAIGSGAGLGVFLSTAFSNGTFVGYASGQGITTGGNNTFLGAYSGLTATTGGSNIVIGYNADVPTATTSNSLNIGNTIYGDLSMKRIGVNVASPTATLEVGGIVSATQFVGDGSLLTGIAGGASSQITSGTTKVSTNSNGYISLTTGGVTTGYFDTLGGLVVPAVTLTGKLQFTVAASPSIVTTSATELRLEQTGDTFGATRLRLVNRAGSNGAVFENDGLDLVDFGFSPMSRQLNSLRLEVRAPYVKAASNTTGEFQFIRTSDSLVWFASGPQGTLISTSLNVVGRVGIGKTNPGYMLDVNGQVAGAGAYVNTSDARLKKDVTPIAYGLDTIMKLRPVGFNWIDQVDAWKKQHQIGLIAQEVEGVIPEVVSVANDTSRTRSLAYGELVPVLIKAVQDLKGENMELQTQNDQMKADMKAMQDMLKQQNQRLDGLEKRTLH